jgi:hypothetical protein
MRDCRLVVPLSDGVRRAMLRGCWQVHVAIDHLMLSHSYLSFHPQTNTASTTLSPSDLLKWFAANHHTCTVVDLAAGKVVPTPSLP